MTTILKTLEIDAPATAVCEKVSDTGRISDLIGFLASSVQTDNTRVCTLEGGGELRETIVSVDHDLQRVVYSITQSPLNMEFHTASMQVQEFNGKTRLTWMVDVLPEEARQLMEPILDGACTDMATTLAS